MQAKTLAFLVMSSVLNAAFGFFMFAFAQFAASSALEGVPPRAGFYVLGAIAVSAAAAVFLPWILVKRHRAEAAKLFALLPLALLVLAALAFVIAGGWPGRIFS